MSSMIASPSRSNPYSALLARVPHEEAAKAAHSVLQNYPLPLIERLAESSVQIWLLDHGEPVSSAGLLDTTGRSRRWLGNTISVDDCAGLTVPIDTGVLVIAPWHRPAVLRHELGHACSRLLTDSQHRRLRRAYRSACTDGRLIAPLAGKSIGEYLACALATYVQPERRRNIRELDPTLCKILDQLWAQPKSAGGTTIEVSKTQLPARQLVSAQRILRALFPRKPLVGCAA
jgi:hypothetical protein